MIQDVFPPDSMRWSRGPDYYYESDDLVIIEWYSVGSCGDCSDTMQGARLTIIQSLCYPGFDTDPDPPCGVTKKYPPKQFYLFQLHDLTSRQNLRYLRPTTEIRWAFNRLLFDTAEACLGANQVVISTSKEQLNFWKETSERTIVESQFKFEEAPTKERVGPIPVCPPGQINDPDDPCRCISPDDERYSFGPIEFFKRPEILLTTIWRKNIVTRSSTGYPHVGFEPEFESISYSDTGVVARRATFAQTRSTPAAFDHANIIHQKPWVLYDGLGAETYNIRITDLNKTFNVSPASAATFYYQARDGAPSETALVTEDRSTELYVGDPRAGGKLIGRFTAGPLSPGLPGETNCRRRTAAASFVLQNGPDIQLATVFINPVCSPALPGFLEDARNHLVAQLTPGFTVGPFGFSVRDEGFCECPDP